jgi:hypothetical protein
VKSSGKFLEFPQGTADMRPPQHLDVWRIEAAFREDEGLIGVGPAEAGHYDRRSA